MPRVFITGSDQSYQDIKAESKGRNSSILALPAKGSHFFIFQNAVT